MEVRGYVMTSKNLPIIQAMMDGFGTINFVDRMSLIIADGMHLRV